MEARDYMVGLGRRKVPIMLRPISIEEAKRLTGGEDLYFRTYSGDVIKVRLYSKVKTWKRDPTRVEFSVKYGFYDVFRVTDRDIIDGRILINVNQMRLF